MNVREWMSVPVYSVKPRDSVSHAREILEQHRINQLPVLVNGKVVGIVTDRDLRDAFPSVLETTDRTRRPARQSDPDRIVVEEVMTANVLTVAPEDPIEKAVHVMQEKRVGALPVLDAGKLVGIVARSDVLESFLALIEWAQASREHESAGPPPEGASDEIRRNW